MKILKLTLCLIGLAVGASATNMFKMMRETMAYEDSCGGHWTLIIHFEDQGNNTDHNNERMDHYSALIDGVEGAANC
jgi:hypothetical protein